MTPLTFSRPAALVAGVLAVLVVLGIVATVAASDARTVAAGVVAAKPVVETTVACPGLRSREGYTESSVAAATPPMAGGAAEATTPAPTSRATVRTLTKDPADGKNLIVLRDPGERGLYAGRSGERDSVVGRGDGLLAPGFSVTQTELPRP